MARHYGVSLIQGTNHATGGLLAEVDAWAADAGRYPSFLPLWNCWSKPGRGPTGGTLFPDPVLVDGLLARGVEPMVYATTIHNAATPSAWNLQSYLDGDHDAMLTAWAAEAASLWPGQRFIVRINQEPGASWCPWGTAKDGPEGYDLRGQPARSRQAMGHIRTLLRSANPAMKTFYCGNRGTALTTYFPGDHRCDYVGFDTYSRDDPAGKSCPKIMDAGIATLNKASDHPVIIGEFGRKVGLPGRLAWLKTLPQVVGGHIFMYFDMDLTPNDLDWTMTPAMRETLASYME